MLGRIDAVVPAGEHRDRSGRKRRTVRRRVDAAREARDHGEAGLAELACDALGEFHAGAGALREPTTATIGSANAAAWPRIATRGGASSIICSRGG
jgi:hypothetical protein